MEYQTITELIEALKMAGKVYNDADFARKTGLSSSFVSEMKSGKKPFTGATRKKIEETFPDSFADGDGVEHKETDDTPLLRALEEIGEQRKLVAQSQGLIEKNQEQIDRLLAIIEKLT